jgi:hypothetical protein
VSGDHGQWKAGEGDERGDDERLLPPAVGQTRRGQRAHEHRGRLHRDQEPEGRRPDADYVHGVEHEEDVHQRVTRADENVREQ